MIVSFCGHKEITEPEKLLPWLEETVEALIQRGADTFYLGGYGAFDRMAADVVWNKKQLYPSVQSILVLPYLDRAVDVTAYDGTITLHWKRCRGDLQSPGETNGWSITQMS